MRGTEGRGLIEGCPGTGIGRRGVAASVYVIRHLGRLGLTLSRGKAPCHPLRALCKLGGCHYVHTALLRFQSRDQRGYTIWSKSSGESPCSLLRIERNRNRRFAKTGLDHGRMRRQFTGYYAGVQVGALRAKTAKSLGSTITLRPINLVYIVIKVSSAALMARCSTLQRGQCCLISSTNTCKLLNL